MLAGRRVLAIVTARGGSKGIPGKNLSPLGGRPLLDWTVEAARGAACIDRVVVTSDDEKILDAARQAGADCVRRPAEIAGDLARQEDAVLHAMGWVERDEAAYGYVVMLAPTNPLRPARLIDETAQFLAGHATARAAMTVIECEHPPLRANVLPADGSMERFHPEELRWKNRQELPTYYRITGAVCIAEWDYFRLEGSFLGPRTYAFVADRRSSIDIDDSLDLAVAEYLQGLSG
jgi:CMP-N,N'-diacetyllegionaminic acid synthase